MNKHSLNKDSMNKLWCALAHNGRRWCAMLAAGLGMATLAGCYLFEPGTAVLDVGSSRIPLALHGAWGVDDKRKDAQVVIESGDGRIGHYYFVVGEGKERRIKDHFPFLMARAGEGVYLMGRVLGANPQADSQMLIPIRFDGTTWQQLARWKTAPDETTDEARAKEAAVARRFALKLGGGAKDDGYHVRGAVSLEAMKRFVAEAATGGLFKDGTIYQEPVYHRLPGTQFLSFRPGEVSFETLRAQHLVAVDKARLALERLLQSAGAGADIKLRFDAWKKQDGADSLLATAEGNLLHAAVHARSEQLTAEQRASLELSARSGAAALGHTESQLWMAQRFEARTSDPLDALGSALRWYELAAAGGSPQGATGEKRVRGTLSALALR